MAPDLLVKMKVDAAGHLSAALLRRDRRMGMSNPSRRLTLIAPLCSYAAFVLTARPAAGQMGRISKDQYISLMHRALDEVIAACKRGEAHPGRAAVSRGGIDFS